MTDKDCGEIASIKEAFPNATHLLCHFHALRAVDRNKNGLTQSEISEIYDQFHAAVYAKTPGEFQKAEEYLTSIQHDNIGRYFEKNWFCDKWVKTWPMIERRELCTMGDNTTNKIERYKLIETLYILSLLFTLNPFITIGIIEQSKTFFLRKVGDLAQW